MKSKNRIAMVLKVYAVINLIGGIVLAINIKNSVDINGIGIYVFFASLIVNIIIFALGEVVQLLHDIKINTGNRETTSQSEIDELPEL